MHFGFFHMMCQLQHTKQKMHDVNVYIIPIWNSKHKNLIEHDHEAFKGKI